MPLFYDMFSPDTASLIFVTLFIIGTKQRSNQVKLDISLEHDRFILHGPLNQTHT